MSLSNRNDDTHIYMVTAVSTRRWSSLSPCLSASTMCGLQVNPAKTELLWSATGRRLHQLPQPPLRVCADNNAPSAGVSDLGIFIDAHLSLKTHVTRTVAAPKQSIGFVTGSPVAGSVSGSITTGLRKCHISRHRVITTQTTPVGDEFRRPDGVLIVQVGSHHFAPLRAKGFIG